MKQCSSEAKRKCSGTSTFFWSPPQLFNRITSRSTITMDTVYFYYFLIHAPLTLLVDDTFIIPPKYQLDVQKQLYHYQVVENHDFLAAELPLWMQYFVWIEVLFQLPLFIVALMDYTNRNGKFSKKLWPYLLIYGFNASFTSLQCLVYIYQEGPDKGLSDPELWKLFALYTPTFLLPAYMTYDFLGRISRLGSSADISPKKLQ